MSLTVTLLAALAWAGYDAARKALGQRHGPLALLVHLHLLQLPALVGWWVVVGAPAPSSAYWAWAAGTLALNAAANGLFITAVTRSPLSLTIPLLSLTPALTALLAIPLLGELPTAGQWVGIVLVVIGALALTVQRADAPGEADGDGFAAALMRLLRDEPGVWMMALVALFWSLTGPLDRRALEHGATSLHALVQVGGIGLGGALWLLIRRQHHRLRPSARELRGLAGGALIGVTAYSLQLVAIQLTLVSVVEAVKRAIGMGSALLTGRLAFDETITAGKLTAVLVLGLGAALVLLY